MKLSLGSITKKFHYGDQPRPGRDWLVLLSIFIIALALSVVYNLYTFSQVTRGEKIGNAPVTTPTQIKLDQVKNLFDARAAERAHYTSDYRFVDPSP